MSKPPVKELRIGLVKATIWKNSSTQKGDFFRVTIARLYKDGAAWKESTRFDRDDLLVLSKLADQAHSWIVEQQQRG